MTLDPESAERDREAAQCRVNKESKPKSTTSSLQTRSKSSVPVKPRSSSATSAATPAKRTVKSPVSTGGSSAMDRLSGASTPARTVGPGVLRPGILESGILDAGRGAPSPSGAGASGASRSTTGSSSSGSGTIDFGRGGSGAPSPSRLR
jgi:hypothetical protein